MAVAMSRPMTWARDSASLTLDELLEEARDSYRLELYIPMTVDQPPVLTSIDGHGHRQYDAAEGAQTGLSMSAQLYRRLGHNEGYGNVFPVARALRDVDGWCRGRHLNGRGGPWADHAAASGSLWSRLTRDRPLCARLAHYAVVAGVHPSRLALVEGLSEATVERLLFHALEHMWAKRCEWAHGDDSGVGEVLAEQRRERREARERAEASRAPGTTCRYCHRPYDSTSEDPCPGGSEASEVADVDEAMAAAGFTLLCSPS